MATVQSEAEAIEIIDVLRNNEIASDKKEVGDEKTKQFQIFVNEDFLGGSDYRSAAYQILSDNCLPHTDPPAQACSGLICSPEEEREKVQRLLKIGIISQLRKIPSVNCVDVIFVFPQDQLRSINPYPATASVYLSYKTQDIGFNEQQIKSLVAGSVPNLQPDNVNVIMTYKPVRPITAFKRSNLNKILLIGGAALFVIFVSIGLVYFLQKRRSNNSSTALAELPEIIENPETL